MRSTIRRIFTTVGILNAPRGYSSSDIDFPKQLLRNNAHLIYK